MTGKRILHVGCVLIATLATSLGSPNAYAQNYGQLQTACKALGTRLIAQGKTTAAVVDFTDLNGNVTTLGRFLAEELSGCLASETELQLIERLRLNAVLQEQKLAVTGVIDPSTAKKLGEIVGAQAIITGTLTPFGETVRLSLRALDVGTARIVGAAAAEIAKTPAIEELLRQDNKERTGSASVRTAGAPAPEQSAGSSTAPPPSQEHTVGGITWQLMDCRKNTGRVACRVMATHHLNEELSVRLLKATALDDYGNDATTSWGFSPYRRMLSGANEIVPITFRLGSDRTTGGPRRASSPDGGLGENAVRLTYLQLEFTTAGRSQYLVRFQNIPVQ